MECGLKKDRVECDIAVGDTQVMLRALDRLHRRLLAMRNICRGIDIQRNTVDITINEIRQLCEPHQKNAKDHIADSLSSSLSLSFVSGRNRRIVTAGR
ncbi:vacuolar protein sorting-associated protein 51 homolog isoform 1-T4 [Glossina fuscipes fuscipes]